MTRLTFTTLTACACACAAVLVLTACGIHKASNRRAAYLEAEAAFYECIESGLTRAECVAGVFGDADSSK